MYLSQYIPLKALVNSKNMVVRHLELPTLNFRKKAHDSLGTSIHKHSIKNLYEHKWFLV